MTRSTTDTAAVRIRPMPAGGFITDPLPGSPSLALMWTGRGSHVLYLIGNRAGLMCQVEPDRFHHDGTERGALAAARAFVTEGSADR